MSKAIAAKRAARALAVLSYVVVGIAHFTHADFFVRIMPPAFPAHLELVWISGVFEILGGIGLAIPRLRRLAGYGLVALLVAVYPANIHMAMHPDQFADLGPALSLYLRLPFKFVFIAWALWVSSPDPVAQA